MKKIKIVLMVVVVFICLAVIIHGQGSKLDEGVVGQVTKTAGDIKNEVGKVKKPEKRIRIEQEGEGENAKRYLRIYDEKGKVKKEIKLGQEIKKIKATDKTGKVREDAKLVEELKAAVTDSGNKSVIIRYYENQIYDNNQENEPTLELKFLDENGNIKFVKEIGKNRTVGMQKDIKIIDKGLIIVRDELSNEDAPGSGILHIFNEKGDEIFTFPRRIDEQIEPTDFVISKNGQYIGIQYSTTKPPYKHSVIFFNLENGKSWDMGEWWGVGEITNAGKVELFSGTEQKFINLEEKIGK